MNTVYPAIETTDFVLIGKSSIKGKRLCLHPVKNETIGAEIPFAKDTAKQIFAELIEKEEAYIPKEFEGLIPPHIIYAKDNPTFGVSLIWTVKKQKKHLVFSDNISNDLLKSDTYSLPTILFSFSKNTLKVFAISDDIDNINEDTELFTSPFFNVYENGSVCMGNVDTSRAKNFKTFNKTQSYLESVFFKSYFTHSNNKEKITEEYILQNKNQNVWNKKNLFTTNLTLKNLL